MKFLLLLALLTSTQLMASSKAPALKACTKDAAFDLTEEHKEWTETFYLVNKKGNIVGAYSYKDDQAQMQVCEFLEAEYVTIANIWYYWEHSVNSNPATFKKGEQFLIYQDEGEANIEVLKTSRSGEISLRLKVTGTGEHGESLDMREDVLTFKKFN